MRTEPGTPASPRLSWPGLAWAALIAAPGLWIALLVYHYGVDFPFWDEWNGTSQIFEKMAKGTLGLKDFFALHNEHRIFFPRLIWFALAKLTQWNVRAELLVVWLLFAGCSVSLWRLAKLTGLTKSTGGYWLLFAANVLLFSPMQWENLLWGFQLAFVLPLTCAAACWWLAGALRTPWNFVVTALLCTISTFSLASGAICWLLTLPLLLFRDGKLVWREHKRSWALWLSVFVLELLLYFVGYHKPPNAVKIVAASRPIATIHYFLADLGGAFAYGTVYTPTTVAAIAGAALLLLLGGCVAYLVRWRSDRALLAAALPWLMPAGWAVGSALLLTLGRAAMGVAQALSSRYVTYSVLLPIALLFLTTLIFRHWRARRSPAENATGLTVTCACVATLFAGLHLLGSFDSLSDWADFKERHLIVKSLVLSINVVDEPKLVLGWVHPAAITPISPSKLKERVNVLNRLGYFRPPLIPSRQIREIAQVDAPGSAADGEIHLGAKGPDGCAITGPAILPDSRRKADGVLLTYDDAQGNPLIFALAIPRLSVSHPTPSDQEAPPRWTKFIQNDQLPEGASIVKAWAFDAERGRAFRLAGQVTVER